MACYRAGGCADIIAAVAERIDARQFNPAFPQTFPRFVQHAVWQYCSQRNNDKRVKSSPGKAVEPCRDVGFHNRAVRPRV
jgi:hypothetical protein